jgi:hypothetical protein
LSFAVPPEAGTWKDDGSTFTGFDMADFVVLDPEVWMLLSRLENDWNWWRCLEIRCLL